MKESINVSDETDSKGKEPTYTYNGSKYEVYAITQKDNAIEHYKKPDASIKCKFRLPAIKIGDGLNNDKFQPMYQLICHNESNKTEVDSVKRLMYDGKEVFFDPKLKRVLYPSYITQPMEDVVEGNHGIKYCVIVGTWRYEVIDNNECPWL